jgi:hypothetical protein
VLTTDKLPKLKSKTSALLFKKANRKGNKLKSPGTINQLPDIGMVFFNLETSVSMVTILALLPNQRLFCFNTSNFR